MQKYEYKIEYFYLDYYYKSLEEALEKYQEQLNQWAEEGWELVSTASSNTQVNMARYYNDEFSVERGNIVLFLKRAL